MEHRRTISLVLAQGLCLIALAALMMSLGERTDADIMALHPDTREPSVVWADSVAHSIVAVGPPRNAIAVRTSSIVTANFGTDMNFVTVTTRTVVAHGLYTGRLSGTVTYDASSRTATMIPAVSYKPGEVMHTSVTSGVLGADSLPLAAEVWQFTADSAPGPGLYADHRSFSLHLEAARATVGDLDGDGDVDLVSPSDLNSTVTVLLNRGDGVFTAQVPYSMEGDYAAALSIGDLDGDGDLDLAVCNSAGTGSLSVLFNEGDGTLSQRMDYGEEVGSTPPVLADLDGDGDMDLVAASAWGTSILVLQNRGDGSFGSSTSFAVGFRPLSIGAGDLDNDGDLDLVTGNHNDNSASILLNYGNGTFAPQETYPVGELPLSVATGDLDADGDLDLALANYVDETISILVNQGDGTFEEGVTPPVDGARAVAISDQDGDGDLDLVVTNYNGRTVSVIKNKGDASFSEPQAHGVVCLYPSSVSTADLNSDGILDLVAGNCEWVSLLLGKPHPPAAPTISPVDNLDGDGAYLVQWSAPTRAVTYTLVEDDNASFASPLVRYIGTATQTMVSSQTVGEWHYRVLASNSGGDSDWSNAETVRVLPRFSISGRVLDETGAPLSGVLITTTSGVPALTHPTGAYTITDAIAGTHYIWARKSGWSFAPWGRMVTVPATGQDFVGFDDEGWNMDLVGHLGGELDGVSVHGDYAFVGEGFNLTVFDITDPFSPTVAASTPPLEGAVRSVEVLGDYVYTAGVGGVQVVDVSDPLHPQPLNALPTVRAAADMALVAQPLPPATHSASSQALALIGYVAIACEWQLDHQCTGAGLEVVNLSDPGMLTGLGFLPTAADVRSVDVAQHPANGRYYAYVTVEPDCGEDECSGGGLQVIDVTDPGAPAPAGFSDTPGVPNDVQVSGALAYVAEDCYWDGHDCVAGGLQVIDISDPDLPDGRGAFDTSRGVDRVAVEADTAFAASNGTFWVVDISDPAHPLELGSCPVRTSGDIDFADGRVYVAGGRLAVVEVSDPTSPAKLGHTSPRYAEDVAIVGTKAYVAGADRGLSIVDISVASRPVELGNVYGLGYANVVAGLHTYAYVAAGEGGLWVVDASNPLSPGVTDFLQFENPIRDIVFHGDHAYLAEDCDYDTTVGGGLRVLDVSDPAHPSPAGFWASHEGCPAGVAVSGNYAYLADGCVWDGEECTGAELVVINISNPPVPDAEHGFALPDDASAVAIDGNTLYLSGGNILRAVDITDPTEAAEVDAWREGLWNADVAVADGRVYASQQMMVDVIDASHPADLTGVGAFDARALIGPGGGLGWPSEVAVGNDYIHLAWHWGGLSIIKHTGDCGNPLAEAEISGPVRGYTDTLYSYTAVISPAGATPPVAYTWSPEPAGGQGTSTATYQWVTTGRNTISLAVENCGAPVDDAQSVTILSGRASAPVEPDEGATLVFTDTQGGETTVEVPAQAVTDAIELIYTIEDTPTAPSGFEFAGHAFTLEAFRDDQLLPGFVFERPVTLTLEYSDADVAGLNESTLMLRFWDGAAWTTDGITVVQRDLEGNRLVLTVTHLTEFAFFAADDWLLHLPIVRTEPPPPVCYPLLSATVRVGDIPHGVAANPGADRLYVASHQDGTLTVIETVGHTPVFTQQVGSGPNGVAYNSTSDSIYVVSRNDDSVSVLRADDFGPVATVGVGSQPNGIAVDEALNRVYVTNYGSGSVSVIDGATNEVSSTLPVGHQPSHVAVNPATSKAYVSLHGEAAVAVIDASGTVTRVNLYDSAGPYGIAVDALRNLVYIATIQTHRIVVIDGSDDTFQGWVEIRRLSDGRLAPLRSVAVNPALGTSGHLYVTTVGEDSGWDQLLMLPKGWSEGFALPRALPLEESREGLVVAQDTDHVYATSREDHLVAVFLDGEPACPTNLVLSSGYQLTWCIAGADGICREFIKY